jgi:hypothetical protein
MDNEQEKLEQETPIQEPEENVVSVWYGSGNTKWFRRRHFEGYTQYETLEPNGKRVMHHVYTGYYYTQELDKRGRLTHRLGYTALALVAGALLLFGSTRPVAANIHWPGGVPAFAGLFGLAWVLYGVVNELLVPQKRTIGDYRATSLSEQRGALVAAIASGVLVLVTVGYAIVTKANVGLHLAAAAAELVAGVLALAIWWLEKKVEYTKTRSELAGKYTM